MLDLLSVQHIGLSASGPTLTPHASTRALVVVGQRTTGGAVMSSVTFGGVALAAAGVAYGQGDVFWAADVTGRASDVLAWSGGSSVYVTAFYLTAAEMALFEASTASLANGANNDTSTAPTGGKNVWGIAVAQAVTTQASPYTAYTDAAAYSPHINDTDNVNHRYALAYTTPAADPDAADTVGIAYSAVVTTSSQIAWVWFNEDEVPELTPEPPGAEVGIPATFEVTEGAPVIWSFAIGGAEVGIPPGFRVSATGPAQVLLAVPGFDRPQLTEGGTEGQVLTYHESAKPAWEEPSGGTEMSSLLVDLTVSGAHTVDRADAATHDLTLTGNATLTPDHSSPVAGEAIDLRVLIRQDGTGGRTLAWGGTITWAGGSAPTMPTDPDATLTVGLLSVDDATTWLGYAVEDGAGTPATTVESETTWGITPAVGTDTEYARQDHTHGTPAEPAGGIGPLLLASDHSTPIVFDDILQASDGSDFLYASEP